MLRKMRADFKKYAWTLWLVILAFLIGFSFTDPFKTNPSQETDLLSIGGMVVSGEEYQKELLQTLEYYSRQSTNKLTQQFITQLRIPEQVLQNMINTAIIQREAEKFNIRVSDAELAERISNYSITVNDEKQGQAKVYIFRENGQPDGRFIGVERYETILARNRIMVKDFENERRNEVIVGKLIDLVTGSLVIDRDTLKEKYKLEKDQAELDYILLRQDRIKQKIDTKDEELKTFYEQNKQDFKSQERRKGNVIAFKYDDFKPQVKITATELFDYFKKNKRMFIVPAKTRISRIFLKYEEKNRGEIFKRAENLRLELTPENFAQKAREFSQDEKAKESGDYGYWGWKNLSSQETSVIERSRGKEISRPIDTTSGFAIVFVSEKTEESQEPFDKVRDRIKGTIEKEKLEVILRTKLEKIYIKLKDDKNIKPKAEKMGLKVIETPAVISSQSIKDLDDMGYIARRLFGLKEGEIGFPVEFVKGMAIVQLTRIENPRVEPFDRVKDKVKEKLTQEKKVDLLFKDAEEISAELNKLKDDKKVEAYLKTKNLGPSSVTYKRGNKLAYLPQKKNLDETIFSLEENRFSSPLRFEREVAVIKLSSKKVTDDSDFEKDKAEFYQEKINELKTSFFNAFVIKSRENYKMDFFNQELFDKIKDYIVSRFKG